MKFFEKFFEDRITGGIVAENEWAVCCPFPHKNPDGTFYYEVRPSAHINVDKHVFHCKVCGQSHSEASFVQALNPGMTYAEALNLLKQLGKSAFESDAPYERYIEALKNSPKMMQEVDDLGLTSVVDKLQLGFDGEGITFPVFMYRDLVDIRTYNPNPVEGQPKVRGLRGSTAYIFPFDIWDKDRPTLLCAGEKDTAIAIANGFNAITFTGGEGSFPELLKYQFTDKKVYIIYDNDQAGHEGGLKVAAKLKEVGATPYIVKLWEHGFCTEKGEDLWDFFFKYLGDANELQGILDITSEFNGEEYEKQRNILYPLINLRQSSNGKYEKRLVSSRVAVVATYDYMYRVPEVVRIQLIDKETREVVVDHEWCLDNNPKDLLKLVEVSQKEQTTFFRALVGAERTDIVRIQTVSTRPVFKAVVTDDLEKEYLGKDAKVNWESYKPAELTVYTMSSKLDLDNVLADGGKYRIFYYPATHPKDQHVVGLVQKIEPSDNSVNRFRMTEDVKKSLECFQGSVSHKMKELYERGKAIIGAHLDERIFYATDLFYHTPLKFKYAGRTQRATLDVALVGESRTGKSDAAKSLMDFYGLGAIVSLKSATPDALVGGSQGTAKDGYKIRLGVLPRNHKGAVIFEEFSDMGKMVAKKLTEVRSSGMVRISRVSGESIAPAMVRMLTISNQPKTADGSTIPLIQFSSGIEVMKQLVGAAEDIARYDFIQLIGRSEIIDPNTPVDIEPYPQESYMNRIRWIWSRKEDQIIIAPEVEDYIAECARELNQNYGCHIQIFGAEAWKKLTRVAIACAACVCSMDDTGENVIVTEEHVAWAYNFLVDCYDNELFKLADYVDRERKYELCDQTTINVVQGLMNTQPSLIKGLNEGNTFNFRQLEAISGLGRDDLNRMLNKLIEAYLVRPEGQHYVPSVRFRTAIRKIKGNPTRLKKIWEPR